MLIRDCEDNHPLLIWDTLKASFVQQKTAPCFNAYHTLLSTQKDNSESLGSLINKVDEQIRVIKSLSPLSFTLDNLYDELAVMAIIRVLPHSFDDIVRTISVLDKFDKQSVNSSGTWNKLTPISLGLHLHSQLCPPTPNRVPRRLPLRHTLLPPPTLSPAPQCYLWLKRPLFVFV